MRGAAKTSDGRVVVRRTTPPRLAAGEALALLDCINPLVEPGVLVDGLVHPGYGLE